MNTAVTWTEITARHHEAVVGDRALYVYPADPNQHRPGTWTAEVIDAPRFDADDLYVEELWVRTCDNETDAKTLAARYATTGERHTGD